MGRAAGGGISRIYPIFGIALSAFLVYMSFVGDLNTTVITSTLRTPLTRHYYSNDAPKMGFVGKKGVQFSVDGKPFYVNGWNSWWLMTQAAEGSSGRQRVYKMIQIGKKMGFTVCRTWAFNDGAYNALQVSLGQFDEDVFKGLDLVVAEARRNGIRLILSLANNLQDYGGKMQYVKWALEQGIASSSSNDSFFFDPSIRSYFKIYIKTLLTRKNHLTGVEYRDDPTIFGWELMNEPRCISDPSGDTLQKWLEEMSSFVKSLDKKHLLTVGFEGFYSSSSPPEKLRVNPEEYSGFLGVDFIRNSKTPTIDFTSVHVYADQWFLHRQLDLGGKIEFASKYIASHIEDGERVLKKPVLFTEFGLSKRYKDFNDSHREAFFKAIFDVMYDSARKKKSGAGSLIWQLMVPDMEEYNDAYGIFPYEQLPSLSKLITQQSCRLAGLGFMKKGSYCQ